MCHVAWQCEVKGLDSIIVNLVVLIAAPVFFEYENVQDLCWCWAGNTTVFEPVFVVQLIKVMRNEQCRAMCVRKRSMSAADGVDCGFVSALNLVGGCSHGCVPIE